MTNPFERGSNDPNPFGQGGAGQNPPRVPVPPRPSAAPGVPGAGLGSVGTGVGERAIESQNLDGRLRELKKASDGMRVAKERLAALVGTGTAADDRIRVTWAAATGLDQLHLDPRAMRMPSQDLADAIKQAIAAAMADLRRQTAEVLKEEVGAAPGGSTAKIQEMHEAFSSQMNDITTRVDDARRAMERALMR